MKLNLYVTSRSVVSDKEVKSLADQLGAAIRISDDEGEIPVATSLGPKIPPTLSDQDGLPSERSWT